MEEQWPIVTFILITISLGIFLFSYNSLETVVAGFGLSSTSIFSRPYTIITHMFVHLDFIHFILNMMMLAVLGMAVENKIGSGKFFFIYLFSGLSTIPFAFLIEVLTQTNTILVGASGAIFGLMFISGVMSGWEKAPVIKLPLLVVIIFYLLLTSVLLAYNFPSSISEFAHLGGLTGGILASLLLLPERKKISI